jgi:hypothetical protein
LIENFFNSPELAKKLNIENCTDFDGTLKLNRKKVPKLVKDKKLEKGVQSQYYNCLTNEI